MSFIDDLVLDISDRTGGAITGISNLVEQDTRTVLLRRFRRSYRNLSVEEVIGIQNTLGHTKAEQKPCKVCQIMATEEFHLAED